MVLRNHHLVSINSDSGLEMSDVMEAMRIETSCEWRRGLTVLMFSPKLAFELVLLGTVMLVGHPHHVLMLARLRTCLLPHEQSLVT